MKDSATLVLAAESAASTLPAPQATDLPEPGPREPGLREQRKQRTTLSLIQRSRELTRSRGLTGFTVDELCNDVAISRRTFFNYFASKEHAVLGLSLRKTFEPGAERFLGSDEPDLALTTPLLDAIIQLILDVSHTSIEEDFTVDLMWGLLSQEPSLLERLNTSVQERNSELAELIRVREGYAPDDPGPEVIATFSLHLAMTAFMDCSHLFGKSEKQVCGSAPSPGPAATSDEKFAHFESKMRRNFAIAKHFFTA